MSKVETRKRSFIGRVTSNKGDKTITVKVVDNVQHEIGKYIKKTTKLHAHDEANICQVGDLVKIEEHRPISKTKTWMLVEVLEKAAAQQ